MNTTGAAVTRTIDIDGVSADINVGSGTVALPLQSVAVTGLSVDVVGFVHLGGNFGFRKSGSDIEVSANSVEAKLSAGASLEVGITGGTLALLIKGDGTKGLDASGSLFFNISGFASATATSVHVKMNTTGAAVTRTIDIEADAARVGKGSGTVALPLQCVAANGLSVRVVGFVHMCAKCGFTMSGGDM